MELKHIVIAVDSFKGSISSMEAGKTAADACRKLLPAARIDEEGAARRLPRRVVL